MQPETEELIEIYGNIEKHRQRIADAAKRAPIPDIPEVHNAQDKLNFGKNRQRAEILKLNDAFLKELSGIKNRLGEKFFRVMEGELIEAGSKAALLKSDFAEPKIAIEQAFTPDYSEYPAYLYYLPGTRISEDGFPESEIDLGRDSFFNDQPLEWVIMHEYDPDYKQIGTPSFKLRCMEEVYNRYLDKWNEFLTKWHISIDWNGDLQYLHLHSLPSVIVERDDKNHNLPVVIRLGAWATSDDIKRAWPRVEEIMKEAQIFRERESEVIIFIRDICWFRMNKKDAILPSKIAHFWAEKFPKEINLEVIEKVTRDEDSFENVPLEERLEEVLSEDPKMAELRGRFFEARKIFIRSGLKDKVKKSIKKTEKRIKRSAPKIGTETAQDS